MVDRGLSVTQTAESMGVSRAQMHRYLKGGGIGYDSMSTFLRVNGYELLYCERDSIKRG